MIKNRCKIDWNILLNKIDSDSISLIKVEEDTKHIFARSLFHIKVNSLSYYFIFYIEINI